MPVEQLPDPFTSPVLEPGNVVVWLLLLRLLAEGWRYRMTMLVNSDLPVPGRQGICTRMHGCLNLGMNTQRSVYIHPVRTRLSGHAMPYGSLAHAA